MVCVSSKQIGQMKGSGFLSAGGCGRAANGESARWDFDDEEEDFADSAVDRRVARRIPLEMARALEDVLERIGAGGVGAIGWDGRTPAEVVTEEALSIYFSMRRSLFQCI